MTGNVFKLQNTQILQDYSGNGLERSKNIAGEKFHVIIVVFTSWSKTSAILTTRNILKTEVTKKY